MTSHRANQHDHTRLRAFAAKHHLKVRLNDTIDLDDCPVTQRQICFGPSAWPRVPLRAVINDLPNCAELLGMLSDDAAGRRFLRRYDAEKRLCLTISPKHMEYLREAIDFRFDLPIDSSEAPETNPESAPWGKRLRKLGIRFFDGTLLEGMVFTFPVDNKAAVRMVLALAQAKVSLKDLPVKA